MLNQVFTRVGPHNTLGILDRRGYAQFRALATAVMFISIPLSVDAWLRAGADLLPVTASLPVLSRAVLDRHQIDRATHERNLETLEAAASAANFARRVEAGSWTHLTPAMRADGLQTTTADWSKKWWDGYKTR